MPDVEGPDGQEDVNLTLEYEDPYEGMEFAPYDPNKDAPLKRGTPLGRGKDGAEDVQLVFDERYREDFEGLMFIGALTSRFSFLGHEFVIRTLTVDELLAAGKLTKEFEDTIGAARAYATAMVALTIVSVDGTGMPSPIGEEPGNDYKWAYERFDYAKARWYPWVVDYIYDKYLLLEERTRQVLEEMTKKAQGRTESTSG